MDLFPLCLHGEPPAVNVGCLVRFIIGCRDLIDQKGDCSFLFRYVKNSFSFFLAG